MIKVTKIQFNKCQAYLNGSVLIVDMFGLLVTYRPELARIIGYDNVCNNKRTTMTDAEVLTVFCNNVYSDDI
jgi:hypothetical protein